MKAFLVAALVCLAARNATAQAGAPVTGGGVTRELSLEAGVMIAPAEIGRDVTAGGDMLVARLGSGGLIGGRLEIGRAFAGAAVNLFVGPRNINVRSTTGVDYPRHGSAPVFYLGDVRLYPFASLIKGGRISPYLAVGAGGALISVDLDNVNDQELRHTWARSVGAGVKVVSARGRMFLDVHVRACRLSGRGPIVPFAVQSIAIGIGANIE